MIIRIIWYYNSYYMYSAAYLSSIIYIISAIISIIKVAYLLFIYHHSSFQYITKHIIFIISLHYCPRGSGLHTFCKHSSCTPFHHIATIYIPYCISSSLVQLQPCPCVTYNLTTLFLWLNILIPQRNHA